MYSSRTKQRHQILTRNRCFQQQDSAPITSSPISSNSNLQLIARYKLVSRPTVMYLYSQNSESAAEGRVNFQTFFPARDWDSNPKLGGICMSDHFTRQSPPSLLLLLLLLPPCSWAARRIRSRVGTGGVGERGGEGGETRIVFLTLMNLANFIKD